jgi:rhamnulokinase
MMNRQFLALDLGAESGRAILAQLAGGRIELNELHRFANAPVQLPNGLYWNTKYLFREICKGIRIASENCDQLDGIGVDTWGVDFGLIGAQGELLDTPRHYRDPRTTGLSGEMRRIVPPNEIFRQTGIQFMDINSLCQLYAVKRDSPALLSAASKLLFMPDLFNSFLTGTCVSERTIASTSQFYDPVKRCFAIELLRALGLRTDLLCELIEPGTELGRLLPQHVIELDAPVYATASHDTASAVAAVPAQDGTNWCYISSGTWSLMGVELDEPVINQAALDANFTNEVGVERKIRFLKNIPGLWMVQECRRAWAREGQEFSYVELMDRAAAANPLATVIDLDEFTSPGDHPRRICEYCLRTSQQVPQDAGSTVRVVLQSLAARYKQVLESLEKLTGRSTEVIHIVGGGSRNKLLNQLTANVTGRRVIAGPAEATAAGNALTQALGRRDVRSLEEIRAVVRRSFELEEFVPE